MNLNKGKRSVELLRRDTKLYDTMNFAANRSRASSRTFAGIPKKYLTPSTEGVVYGT